MNLEDVLGLIQDFRTQLDVWGVTNKSLLIAGAIAGILFLLSLREVAGWFLRTHQIRSEVKALRGQLSELQAAVHELNESLIDSKIIDSNKPLKAEELVKAADRFKFDH